MAVELLETPESRAISNGSITMNFIARGSADEQSVFYYVKNKMPVMYGSSRLVRDEKFSIAPLFIDVNNAARCLWTVAVVYKPPDRGMPPPPEVGTTVRIRVTAQTSSVHTQVSLGTVRAYGDGATTADFGNLIRATEDATEGAEVLTTDFDMQVTKIFASGSIPTLAAIVALSQPPTVNNSLFTVHDTETELTLGMPAGTCLFVGVSFGNARADGALEYVYNFRYSPNVTGKTIGTIGGIAKDGHEYLWVRYDPSPIVGLKRIGQKPSAVYVEKMYEAANFSPLGI